MGSRHTHVQLTRQRGHRRPAPPTLLDRTSGQMPPHLLGPRQHAESLPRIFTRRWKSAPRESGDPSASQPCANASLATSPTTWHTWSPTTRSTFWPSPTNDVDPTTGPTHTTADDQPSAARPRPAGDRSLARDDGRRQRKPEP